MSRRIRFIPDSGALVEVTCRALQSRFLLRPGPTLDAIILGALARAQRRYAVRIIAFFFASNHLHLILEVDDARQLAIFMNYFLSKVAREIGRLTGWREKIFGRRYQAIQISDEPEAQIARLRYVLSHGCKENLVERLQEWPGVHCVEALTTGKALEGWWFDRTQEYLARRRGETFGTYQYATRESFELAPLPCWKHLPPEKRQSSPPPWSRRSKRKPPTAGSGPESRRSALPPSSPRAPRAALSRPSARPRRPSTPPAAPSAASCATPTSSSSPPTGAPPRSSGPDTATRPSPWAASRRRCPSWAGRRRPPSQGYVCPDEPENHKFKVAGLANRLQTSLSRPRDRPRSRRRSPRTHFGRRRRAKLGYLQLFGWHLFPAGTSSLRPVARTSGGIGQSPPPLPRSWPGRLGRILPPPGLRSRPPARPAAIRVAPLRLCTSCSDLSRSCQINTAPAEFPQ